MGTFENRARGPQWQRCGGMMRLLLLALTRKVAVFVEWLRGGSWRDWRTSTTAWTAAGCSCRLDTWHTGRLGTERSRPYTQ